MKKLIFSAILATASVSALADEGTYTIQTTTGQTVLVSGAELRAVYESIPTSNDVNLAYKNSDGSTSFKNPRMLFNGSWVYIFLDTVGLKSPDGYCKLRGFSKPTQVSRAAEQPGVFNPDPALVALLAAVPAVAISENGTITHAFGKIENTRVAGVITCK